MNKSQTTNHKLQTNSNAQITIKKNSFVCNFGIRYCLLLMICSLLFGTFDRSFAQSADQVCFRDQCINVEVVLKDEERSRGLMFRESLAVDSGMLFIFEKSWPYAFWMKDTLIPLDMIWLDEARKIVHIEKDVPPCTADPCPRYVPAGDALYVLEVNAGYAAKLGLQLGDTAEFQFGF